MKKNIVKSTLFFVGVAVLLLNGSAYAASKKCYTRIVTIENNKEVIVMAEKNHGKIGNMACYTKSWFRFHNDMQDQRTNLRVTNVLLGVCARTQKTELKLWPQWDRSRNSKRKWKSALSNSDYISFACF